jgi:hypothetical protein
MSSFNAYEPLLKNLCGDYHQGAAQTSPIVPDDAFNIALYQRLEQRLSLSEQLLLRRALGDRDAGLYAARHDRFAIAAQLFREARQALLSPILSAEAKLMHQSLLYQSETYLDYRQSQFDRVREKIAAAIAIDIQLEDQYGYGILHLHRIQLLHNLVRLEMRCQDRHRALGLAGELLAYLTGIQETLPIGQAWSHARVQAQPLELVELMLAQIVGEIAFMLAVDDHNCPDDLPAAITATIADPRIATIGLTCHHWLQLKQAFLHQDYQRFLTQSSRFLALKSIPILWYAVIVDLLRLCQQWDSPMARCLKATIVQTEVDRAHLIPAKFRPFILGMVT